MARVTVRMYATLRDLSGEPEHDLEAGNLDDVLTALGDIYGERMTGAIEGLLGSDGLVILVNGRNVALAALGRVRLKDGDEVALFPPVSGG